MLKKYVEVTEDNIAVGPVYVYGDSQAPVSVISHDTPEDVEAGSFWDGQVWRVTAAMIRDSRDQALLDVDAVAGNAIRWDALPEAQKQAWVAYRQKLLDLPSQAGFPDNVTWPIKP